MEEHKDNTVRFSFKMSMEDFNFLQKLSYNKIVSGNLKYKITSALIEGIEILIKQNPNIPKSSYDELRRYIGGKQKKTKEEYYRTSIDVPKDIHEFIKDYIYYKLEKDSFYTNFYFVAEVIELLKNKYKNKLVEIPPIQIT
jgi:hypothetical protein